MTNKSITVFFVGIFSTLISSADFQSEMSRLSDACSEQDCEKPYSKKEVYRHDDNLQIDAGLKIVFQRIAFRQAQIWGDTILEGDYAAEGNTRLDKVVKLYKNSEPIGFLISYSEKAWDTASCLYDGIHDSTLLGCTEGRIYESSYVSPSFRDYFYDSKTMAVFK